MERWLKKKVERNMLHCMLRITSGLLRGLVLEIPKGDHTRPSRPRLRQGTFNVLKHSKKILSSLSGAVVIDLFAGSGAWGIEAMGHGVSTLCFVESHPFALHALKNNLLKIKLAFQTQNLQAIEVKIFDQKVEQCYSALPQAHVIFCDPPYRQGWFEKIEALEALHNRLLPGGVLLFEKSSQEASQQTDTKLLLVDTKIYGDSAVQFFIKQS